MFCVVLRNFKKQLTARIMPGSELVSQRASLKAQQFLPNAAFIELFTFYHRSVVHTALVRGDVHREFFKTSL